MLIKWRLSLYTFGAVFLAIFLVGVAVVPYVLNYAQRIYFILQADVNQRHVQAMTRFIHERQEAGVGSDAVIQEFQAIIEGTQTDRGYLCLINQADLRILSHPEAQRLGMAVKPMATFDRNFTGEQAIPWQDLIKQAESASGLLSMGPNMSPEIIHFAAVPSTEWTLSSHENTARVYAETKTLRRTLSVGAVFIGLLFAIPASFAALQVSRRRERQIEKENELKRKLLEAESARKTQELERTQETIKIQEQLMVQEKMASLGTLTAGVAHELNNPASAAQRGSQQLLEVFTKLKQTQTKLYQLNLSSEQHKLLLELEQQIQARADVPIEMDAVTRSDLECKLETVLDDLGVEDAWDLAPTLVNLGYDAGRLASLAEAFTQSQLTTVIKWLCETHPIYSLFSEISQGTKRISEIVRALRTYSYFDQAPVQEVDVHEGLDNTLILLRHKLKAGTTVHRHYSKELPKIQAYGGELNQVWTNIIDNAIGAMEGKGEVSLRTYQEDQQIVVEIEDNGRGISPEVQSQLFDPFCTTKPQGEGTGLGLHISYNIVRKHHGEIKVNSKPASTCFVVKLPMFFEDTNQDASNT